MGSFPRRATGDGGASLALALAFLTLFGLVVAAILSEVDVNLKTSAVLHTSTNMTYAADGGVEWAIQQLRASPTLCADSAQGTVTLPNPPTVNGRTVAVTCQTTSGSSSGDEGYAVVTTDPSANGLQTKNGVGQPVALDGPVFIAGSIDSSSSIKKPVEIHNGDLVQKSGCTAGVITSPFPAPITNLPNPPFVWRCSPSTSLPDAKPGLPDLTKLPVNPATKFKTGTSDCRIFIPGKYTALPAIGGAERLYFASGAYYFEDITWSLSNEVFFGAPTPINGVSETKATTPTPCATDADAGLTANGTGAVVILGGSSIISLTSSGRMEVYSRLPPAGVTSEPTSYLSFVQVPASYTGTNAGQYKATTVPTSSFVLDESNGSNPELAVHGTIYAPSGSLYLKPTNSSVVNFTSGLHVFRLTLEPSASSSGVAVSVRTGAGQRQVVITSKALGTGERDVVSTAVVNIANDSTRTVAIASWRTV